MKKKGQLALVSTQLACLPCQYVCGLLLPPHLFMASSPTPKFSLNPSSGHDTVNIKVTQYPCIELAHSAEISWAQQHWGTGSVLVAFAALPPRHRDNILLLPPSLTSPVFLLCPSRMSLEPSSLSSSAHCSVLESIWPTKQRACSWNLNVAQTELL